MARLTKQKVFTPTSSEPYTFEEAFNQHQKSEQNQYFALK